MHWHINLFVLYAVTCCSCGLVLSVQVFPYAFIFVLTGVSETSEVACYAELEKQEGHKKKGFKGFRRSKSGYFVVTSHAMDSCVYPLT